MAEAMRRQPTPVLLVIVVAFYAGELVWRERGAKISEVDRRIPAAGLDSSAVEDWTALAAVIVAFLAAGVIACMGYPAVPAATPTSSSALYLSDIALQHGELPAARRAGVFSCR